MAGVRYKFHDYKGCPGITILHFVLDLVFTLLSVVVIGFVINSFSDGAIRMGIISILVIIALGFVYFKLEDKLDSRGKAEEAKNREQRESFVQSASAEEIIKLEKQEKKDEIFMVVGIIISIMIVVPVMASIFILCLMHM